MMSQLNIPNIKRNFLAHKLTAKQQNIELELRQVDDYKSS